jgi:hypothetical protein
VDTSPERKHLRAIIAGRTSHHGPNDAKVLEAQRDLRAVKLAEHIAAVVAQAPPLTCEQRDRLAELLRPARQTNDEREHVAEALWAGATP